MVFVVRQTYNHSMNTQLDQKINKPFAPHRWVRAGHIQTLLARYQPRYLGKTQGEYPLLLDAGPDVTGYAPEHPVRLLGYYTPNATANPSRGLVLTLHGWEGCSHSTYNLLITYALTAAGYDVFRLNLRDHGPGIHVNPYALNPGLFLGTLLDEAATAVQRVAEMAGEQPFYLVGASMGGNFALRLAARHRYTPFHHLQKVIAFNPAINPATATAAIDRQRLFRQYFRKRWFSSLRAKQALFPHLYNFDPLAQIPLITDMTEWLVQHYGGYYGGFSSAAAYFNAYAVQDDAFGALNVPTTIITARNDPVIPSSDFAKLTPHPLLDVQIHPSGGHVGFVDIFPLEHKLPGLLLDELRAT